MRNQAFWNDVGAGRRNAITDAGSHRFPYDAGNPALTSTHLIDAEVNKPELFAGRAKERIEKLSIERNAQELRRQDLVGSL